MVGLPGSVEHVNIYAIETAPASAIIEEPGVHPYVDLCRKSEQLSDGTIDWDIDARRFTHPTETDWYVMLRDGGGGANCFEACVKYTAGMTTLYYPAGVGDGPGLDDPDDVLTVFEALSWREGGDWKDDIHDYR